SLSFSYCSAPRRDLHSFPTRRSSDLADIWNAYEISWLNSKGKPVVATATFTVPQNSPNLVESKSLKLYLNSFNEERFEDQSEVRSEEHTSELQSRENLVCRLLLEKKK